MRLIYFTTQYVGQNGDPRLVSIGCVDDSGENVFYAELSDTWGYTDVSAFAHLHVLPLLDDPEKRITRSMLCKQLATWINGFEGPVQLATDSIAWDWIWILEILGTPCGTTWPANLHRQPFLLSTNHITDYNQFIDMREAAYTCGGLRRYHALDAAKANQQAGVADRARTRSMPPSGLRLIASGGEKSSP